MQTYDATADSSHFIRAFKRQYGQTPAQFARLRSDESARPEKEYGSAIEPEPPAIGPPGS